MHATVCGSVFGCEFGRIEGVGEVEGMKREKERYGLIEGENMGGNVRYDTKGM